MLLNQELLPKLRSFSDNVDNPTVSQNCQYEELQVGPRSFRENVVGVEVTQWKTIQRKCNLRQSFVIDDYNFTFFLDRVTRRFEKKPKFSKSSPNSIQEKKKSHNIYNKAQFESPKYVHQITFETLKYLKQTMF